MSGMAYGRRDAAIAHSGRQLDLGSWRGARADLVNDEGATARLVVSVQCGDTRAFDLLDRAFRPGLYRYLRATLRNADDAQEVTQLVFLRALEKIGTCRTASESFAPWLYGIARNAGIDHLRKHTRTAVEEPAAIDRRRECADPLDAQVDGHWGERADVYAALQRLPELQRTVIVLRYLVGLNAAEIGDVIGCTSDSVRHFHQRALRALRRGCAADSTATAPPPAPLIAVT